MKKKIENLSMQTQLTVVILSVIVLAFGWTRQQINRKEGILMLLMYAAYMVYICVR